MCFNGDFWGNFVEIDEFFEVKRLFVLFELRDIFCIGLNY